MPLELWLEKAADSGEALVWDHHATRDSGRQHFQHQRADRLDREVLVGLRQDQGYVHVNRNSGLTSAEDPAN